jgi:hypothetical protein
MHSEDRLIHFSTELIHPPARHDKAALQRLYFDLAQSRAAYDNTDFTVPGQTRFHSLRGNRTQSVVSFVRDRIVLVEEWVDIPLSSFLEKVKEVASRASEALSIPVFPLQAVTLRSTFVLSHFSDARVFLLDHVCGQEGRIGPFFRRPILTGGLKIELPATPEQPGDLQVTIQSFRQGINEVFVEVRGIFNGPPITRDTLDLANANIERVRRFITESVFPYLDQYDRPGVKG